MTLPAELKKQLNTIVTTVSSAEKVAEKQIRTALKSTEKFRQQQLKTVQNLIKKARNHKKGQQLLAQAEKVKRDIESRATTGLDLLLAKLNLPTKKEVERLNKRMANLQKRLDQVESSAKK